MAKFQFLPVETKFFDWFEKSSDNLLSSSQQLFDLLQNHEQAQTRLNELRKAKQEGELISQEVTSLLITSLVVPIDSEDIERLMHFMDETMDAVEGAAARLVLFKIDQPKENAKKLAELILKAVQELHQALPNLRLKKNYPELRQHVKRIQELKQEASNLFLESLKEIIDDHQDMFNFLRWKEVYETQKRAMDHLKEIANTLLTIVIKNG